MEIASLFFHQLLADGYSDRAYLIGFSHNEVWDPDTGHCLSGIKSREDLVSKFVCAPDESHLAVSEGEVCRVVDLLTGKCLTTLKIDGKGEVLMRWSRNGN